MSEIKNKALEVQRQGWRQGEGSPRWKGPGDRPLQLSSLLSTAAVVPMRSVPSFRKYVSASVALEERKRWREKWASTEMTSAAAQSRLIYDV